MFVYVSVLVLIFVFVFSDVLLFCKIVWWIVLFLFFCYVVLFFDCINIGFV